MGAHARTGRRAGGREGGWAGGRAGGQVGGRVGAYVDKQQRAGARLTQHMLLAFSSLGLLS